METGRIPGRHSKHPGGFRRLKGMHAEMHQIASSVIRIGALFALAMLLILVLLPAVLAVQAANT